MYHSTDDPSRLHPPARLSNDRAAWLQGASARCALPPAAAAGLAHRFVLLGAPGVGKGTQAELLHERTGACHLSTGDVFRAAQGLTAEAPSPALVEALTFMRRGDLVPDTTVLAILRERRGCLCCQRGFLLDGFPRTLAQARALDGLLAEVGVKIDRVINYEMPLEEVVSRLSGRRTCPRCKAVYHVDSRPPAAPGVCDGCGAALEQREDDRPESIRVRLRAYERSTAPLTELYRDRGLLLPVAARGAPEEVLERTLAALAARG